VPSGLLDWPRPFVFRPQPLGGPLLAPGEQFWVDFHLFDLREPWIETCVRSLHLLARDGLGAQRGGVSLSGVDLLNVDGDASRRIFDGESFQIEGPLAPVLLELNPAPAPATRIGVRFLSPTELKGGGAVWDAPVFSVLFARIRDRISTLRALYGAGPLRVDFKGLGERAARVRTVSSDVRRVHTFRRSSRTGQTHPLGGFTGAIEYEGDLGEFVALLRAARWTGVGRQTVWGKGAIEVSVLEPGG
jgi:hypothetical protein